MAFFDDLGKKISQTGAEAADKAKEVAQVAKLKSRISDEERNIKQQYIQIGKAFYEANPDCVTAPYADMIAAIKVSEGNIASLQRDIDIAKGK